MDDGHNGSYNVNMPVPNRSWLGMNQWEKPGKALGTHQTMDGKRGTVRKSFNIHSGTSGDPPAKTERLIEPRPEPLRGNRHAWHIGPMISRRVAVCPNHLRCVRLREAIVALAEASSKRDGEPRSLFEAGRLVQRLFGRCPFGRRSP